MPGDGGAASPCTLYCYRCLGLLKGLNVETVCRSETSSDHNLNHRLAWALLSPGPVRTQLEFFSHGAPMSELPALSSIVDDLTFIPICEQAVERAHGDIHKRTAGRKVAPQYVSLGMRLPMLAASLDAPGGAERFEVLCECFDEVRTARNYCEALRVSPHPAVKVHLDAKCVNTGLTLVAAASVVYGHDLLSKFSAFDKAKKETGARNRKMKVLAKSWLGAASLSGLERVVTNAMADHFREVGNKTDIFSLPSTAMMQTASLGSCLGPASRQQGGPAQLEQDSETRQLALASNSDAEQDRMYFRVVDMTPTNAKTVPLEVASGRPLQLHQIVITIHDVTSASEETAVVALSPSSASDSTGLDALFLLSSFGADAELVEAGCLRWHAERELSWTVRGMPYCAKSSALLQHLLKERALDSLHRTAHISSAEQLAAAQQLEMQGIVHCMTLCTLPGTEWCLTGFGVRSLQPLIAIKEPLCVFRIRGDCALCDMTSYELLLHLRNAGWVDDVFKAGRRNRPAAFVPGGALVWYRSCTLSIVNRRYLLALAQASAGELPHPVEHCRCCFI
jgi:hypothetical protein